MRELHSYLHLLCNCFVTGFFVHKVQLNVNIFIIQGFWTIVFIFVIYNTQKLTTVCLPYVKGLAKRIQKIYSPYDIRTIFTSGSTLQRYLFSVKIPTEYNMTKNCVLITCCGKVYKGETCCLLKVRLEEHQKVVQGEIEKSGMADHI